MTQAPNRPAANPPGAHAAYAQDVLSDAASSTNAPDVVAAAVSAARAALDELRAVEWSQLHEKALLASAGEVERALRSGIGVQVRLAREFERRGVGVAMGARSPAHALHQALNITLADARARISAANVGLESQAMSGASVEPRDPQVTTCADDGVLSAGHLRVITRFLAKIPECLDEDSRDVCRTTMLDQAHVRDEYGLGRVADKILSIVDPDGSLSGTSVDDRAELTIGARRADGLTPIRGLLSPLTAEAARTAIESLARPCPIDDHTPDPRSASLRREQAFGELLHRFLACGQGPRAGGVRPRVVVTIGIDDLFGRLDSSGVAAPPGGAWSDFAGPQAPALARILACDAEIIPQVLGGDSVVLDQGHAERLFTPEQRRALVTRDKGCSFPGCEIPASWCEAHHIVWWSRDGDTSIDNGALLCRRHHVLIHQEDWLVRADPTGGRPWFVPPPYVDLARKPRRNCYFHFPGPTASRGYPQRL